MVPPQSVTPAPVWAFRLAKFTKYSAPAKHAGMKSGEASAGRQLQ